MGGWSVGCVCVCVCLLLSYSLFIKCLLSLVLFGSPCFGIGSHFNLTPPPFFCLVSSSCGSLSVDFFDMHVSLMCVCAYIAARSNSNPAEPQSQIIRACTSTTSHTHTHAHTVQSSFSTLAISQTDPFDNLRIVFFFLSICACRDLLLLDDLLFCF